MKTIQWGVCTAMGIDDPADLGLGRMEQYEAMGFDYLELPMDRIMNLDEAAFGNVVSFMRDQPLPCMACNNLYQPSVALTGSSVNAGAFLQYTEKALDRCCQLGANKVIFGSGGARSAPPGFPLGRAQVQLEEKLVTLCEMANARNITVILEHLNRFESNLVTTFAESAKIVKRLSLGNLKTILDTHHFYLGNERPALFEENADVIGHMHYARVWKRQLPLPDDVETLAPFLEEVRHSGYQGTISAEAFLTDDILGHRRSLSLMRKLVQ